MRFGLVGTGPWATMAHGPGLLAASNVELVGVWGRSLEKAEALAASLGVTAYGDYDALLADVDAVAFAVPPDIQAEMAMTAARAGKHLLLDKPIAVDVEDARALRDATAAAGVASSSSSPTASSAHRERGSVRWPPPVAGGAAGCGGSVPSRRPATRSAPRRGGTSVGRSGTPGRTRCRPWVPRWARSSR